MIKNRQIKTGSTNTEDSKLQQSEMKLKVLQTGTVDGEPVTCGQIISCSKSQARRYFAINSKMFEVVVD